MTMNRVSTCLLWSLVPIGLYWVLSAVILLGIEFLREPYDDFPINFWTFILFLGPLLGLPVFSVVLIIGAILKTIVHRHNRQIEREGQALC